MSAAGKLPPSGEVIPLFKGAAGERGEGLLRAAKEVANRAFASAEDCDRDSAYPQPEVVALQQAGLLVAPLPCDFGGEALGGLALAGVLRAIGFGSLPLGRLFEGHVNALALVAQYGRREQVSVVADAARSGKLLGVWNTDDRHGLRLIAERGRYRLEGRKILASGAGHIERPIVTATDERGKRLMAMPRLRRGERTDLSMWTAHGMRASATGAVDFSGIEIELNEILGDDGDYERQPAFSGGAWRFAAVHLGGMERLFELLREHLRHTNRGADPHQAARLGQAAIATETAGLWVTRAAALAEDSAAGRPSDQIVAYVNLARLAVERAALDLLELTHRSIGLQAFVRPHPVERLSRDLATYLRQPAPDRALTSAAAWLLETHASTGDLWS